MNINRRIREQEERVRKASADIPTWGGRSFYVDYRREIEILRKLKDKKIKRRMKGGGQ